jgi:thiamine kinase-like enzyme
MAGQLSAATTAAVGTRQITALCRQLEFFAEHPPFAISPLASGDVNLSYQVETRRGHYVLRRYPASSSRVYRQQELRCQHAAAIAGIAPVPLCLNNHQRVLISEYITGGKPFFCTGNRIPLLAITLARLHKLPVQTPKLDPCTYLQRLANSACQPLTPADTSLLSRLVNLAGQYQLLEQDWVLCHLDLHAGNMLYTNDKLWLLDFEYAQLADSCFDLAAVSLYLTLDPLMEQALLSAYTQQRKSVAAKNGDLNKRVLQAKILFSGFCWLWYLSLPKSAPLSELHAAQWRNQINQLFAL